MIDYLISMSFEEVNFEDLLPSSEFAVVKKSFIQNNNEKVLDELCCPYDKLIHELKNKYNITYTKPHPKIFQEPKLEFEIVYEKFGMKFEYDQVIDTIRKKYNL